MSAVRTALVWFKSTDLRIHDHQPLATALGHCIDKCRMLQSPASDTRANNFTHCLPVFIFDPRFLGGARSSFGFAKSGVRRAQFLNESVADLRRSLRQRGTDLAVRVGRPEDILPGLCKAANVHTVFAFEDCYHEEKAIESATAKALNAAGVAMRVCWGGTLIHRDDLPFNVARELPGTFTNFRTKVERSWTIRSSRDNTIPSAPVRRPFPVQIEPQELPSLSALGYSDAESTAVDRRAACAFVGGESAALARVTEYIWTRDLLKSYKETRNGMLGADYSSKFSPWLAHGCLSPLLIYEEVQRYEAQRVKNESTYWLIFELLFRDFFRLYAVHFGAKVFFRLGTSGKVGGDGVQPGWSKDMNLVQAWIDGRTGHPFVDANMRELQLTGFMSNRGRQNVASFFTKDLGCDWRIGAEYFESTLLDYDVGCNWGNWNYVAGVGPDPREGRYFNINKQAKQYDSDQSYRRTWLPELALGTYGPRPPVVPLMFGEIRGNGAPAVSAASSANAGASQSSNHHQSGSGRGRGRGRGRGGH